MTVRACTTMWLIRMIRTVLIIILIYVRVYRNTTNEYWCAMHLYVFIKHMYAQYTLWCLKTHYTPDNTQLTMSPSWRVLMSTASLQCAAHWNTASVLHAQSRMNGPEWPSNTITCTKLLLNAWKMSWPPSTAWYRVIEHEAPNDHSKQVKHGQTTSFTCNFDFASETFLNVCFAWLQLTNQRHKIWVFQVRSLWPQDGHTEPIQANLSTIVYLSRYPVFCSKQIAVCPGLPKIRDPGEKRWSEDATPTVTLSHVERWGGPQVHG